MANAIRARGIATFLKCSQKQQVQTSGRGEKGGHKLATTSWKSFGQQAVAALARHGHRHGRLLLLLRRHRLGVSVGQNFPAYVCHIYAWAAQELRYLRPGCTRTCGYWGNCNCLWQLPAASSMASRSGVLCWCVLLGPLVTVLKLSNMPPWTVPQQLTDKCRWPGSKYCWKHFLISRHPARPALHPNTTLTIPCSLWHGKLLGQKETLERQKHSGAIFMQVIEIYKPKWQEC